MPEDYKRVSVPFTHKGIDLNRPTDLVKAGFSPLGKNIRSYSEGAIVQRPGLTAVNATPVADLGIHSGRLLSNPLPSAAQAYGVFIGAGSALYSDNSAHNAFTSRATGYSGNPLFFMPARPDQSPEPYMYVGDSSKLTKSKVDGTTVGWGIAAPTVVPSIALSAPSFKLIDDFTATTFADWSSPTGALTNPDRLAAVAISNILYDTGSTGWCLVNPAVFTDIREGMFVTLSVNAETVPIDSIYKAVTTTTIGSIKYDSGTSGLCTIQLAAPTAELTMNSMLRIAAAENVRVLSVTYGPDGIPSFRCSTAATRSAGDAVAGLDAFRVYFANTHTTADTLSTKMIQLVTPGAGITTMSRTVALDLSVVNSRPITNEDYVCIQIQTSDPALIDKDFQVLFDLDDLSFTKNWYWYSIRASDLQPSATQTLADLTVQQRVVQRQQLDGNYQARLQALNVKLDPDLSRNQPNLDAYYDQTTLSSVEDPITQTVPGLAQWTVLYIPVGSFQRGGSDTTKSWKNVQALRLSFSATAIITVKVDGWWIGGTYGPNTLSNQDATRSPYFYVYRYRSSASGAKSAPSPPNRSGIEDLRSQNVLTPTVSSDGQVDKIDWFRFGGTLNDFIYIGTQANSGTFSDSFADDTLDLTPTARLPTDNDGISLDLQPFPVIDIPRTGVCDVVGTEITRVSGDTFNTSWIRNNQIIIDGTPVTLYSNSASTSRISLNENIGTKSSVSFFVPGAIIAGQTLDAYFGPWGGGEAGVTIFGVKDGILYWTNGNDPDSCAKGNRLEVAAASEPLMNGCVYDGRPFLFSTERMWEVQPNSQVGFITQVIAYGKGLYARWGLTVGDTIYYVYKDGIYQWPVAGGKYAGLTDADFYPFFPHEGQSGITTNTLVPPNFSSPTALRLNYAESQLYFDYVNTSAAHNSLVYDSSLGVFVSVDTYNMNFHFGSEGSQLRVIYLGGNDGKLYKYDETTLLDGATTFTATVWTPSVNDGDARTKKLLGDGFIELSAVAASTVTVTPEINNYTSALAATTVTGTGVRNQTVIGLPQEPQTLARNLGLQVEWTSTANAKLFSWEMTYSPRPADTITRATDWQDSGSIGPKYYQGIQVKADTYGENKTVEIHYTDSDGVEQTGPTITMNHDGQSIRDYAFPTPFYGFLVRLVPTDANPWELFQYEIDAQPSPQYGDTWSTPETSLGMNGYFHLHRGFLSLISTATVTMNVVIDGTTYPSSGYTFTSTNGSYEKVAFQFVSPTKGKSIKFVFSSDEPFRIFQQDLQLYARSWGDAGPFRSIAPFGGASYTSGAEI